MNFLTSSLQKAKSRATVTMDKWVQDLDRTTGNAVPKRPSPKPRVGKHDVRIYPYLSMTYLNIEEFRESTFYYLPDKDNAHCFQWVPKGGKPLYGARIKATMIAYKFNAAIINDGKVPMTQDGVRNVTEMHVYVTNPKPGEYHFEVLPVYPKRRE